MIGGITQLVDSGPLLLALPVAAAAGAVTFLSPCCLPLVPGYLSYLTGMTGVAAKAPARAATVPASSSRQASIAGAATASGPAISVTTMPPGPAEPMTAGPVTAKPVTAPRGRAVAGTLLFVLGFSVVFVLEGVFFGAVGHTLRLHITGLTQLLGGVVILLGLMFAGAFDRLTFTGRIFRPQFRPSAGLAGAPLLGALFGLSWTPCIGPTLGAVLTLGLTTGDAGRAGLLAFVYALGLGIPFLVVAFAVQRGVSVFGFARRHARLITQIGGIMLIAVGLLEVSGAWATVLLWMKVHWLAGYNPPI